MSFEQQQPEERPMPENSESLELFGNEVEEWSNVIEQAKTPEERRKIVKTLMTCAILDGVALSNEGFDKTLKNIDPGYSSEPQALRMAHQSINVLRTSIGLPPKWSESIEPGKGEQAEMHG